MIAVVVNVILVMMEKLYPERKALQQDLQAITLWFSLFCKFVTQPGALENTLSPVLTCFVPHCSRAQLFWQFSDCDVISNVARTWPTNTFAQQDQVTEPAVEVELEPV